MKTLLAILLATVAGASFAAAPTATLNHDPATYRNVTQKAAADYKVAAAKCTSMSGNAKDICMEEARSARAHAEADAVAQYNNTAKGRAKAMTAAAEADYGLAKARCGDMSGADKDSCMNTARSAHTAALADAKSNRQVAGTADASSPATASDAATAAAVDKCAQVAGQPKTGCLIDNRSADTSSGSTTGATATTAAGGAAQTAVDKTRNAAATAADKTRDAAATVADKTSRAADTVAAKSSAAADKTGAVVADSVITTKVKADIFKEPELKSMAIHVETQGGVVMLSGFVDTKADADKAVQVARSVDGVTNVKSAIKVK
ncbi:MAG TPA: BON domain-containing protein [Telluria sp.]|nr:BON domain-containing protein [Telluria sp.]